MADMELLGVHHVAINVKDVDAAIDFYVNVLGMSVRTDRPDFGIAGAWLQAGDQQIHLIELPVPPAQGQHFALRVGDLPAVVDELRGRGIEISDPSGVGPGRQSFLTDPSGNQVELQQVIG